MKVGDVIDQRYRLVRKLGMGGMAQVFEALDLREDRPVAIKRLHPDLVDSPETVKRFMREALAVRAIESRHVVQVYDAVWDEGREPPYLVLELIRGTSLIHVMFHEAPLAPTRAADLIAQACEGLAVAHGAGIVHRDLNPENLMVTSEADGGETLRILDFGIALLGDLRMTLTDAVAGTPWYMAPELYQGLKNADPRSDIYSLGVILYEALTGTVPYQGKTVAHLVRALFNSKPVPLRVRRPELSEELERIVHRAMARDPGDRFPSARDLGRALADASTSQTK